MLGQSNISSGNSVHQSFDSDWLKVIAYYISAVFSPPLTGFYGILLCSYAVDFPSIYFWTILFLSLFLLLPTIYILFLVKKGVITDFHMKNREDRIRPLSIIFVHLLLSFMLYHYLGGPLIFMVLALCGLIMVGLIVFISLYWKISGHCAAAGGLFIIALNYYDKLVFILALSVALVAWSRVRLGKHSLPQTLVGIVLGAVVTFGLFSVWFN
ncbi:MAG: phosphatase PAP2 family protein [Thermodesulfobacteriota bacterium]